MGTIVNPYIFAAAGGTEPDDISGLLIWFKADAGVFSDAGSTPAGNGETVQQWNDQSGNAIHASKGTPADGVPIYRTNVVNGKPAVEFVGGWMSFTEQTVTPFTLFVVVKHVVTSDPNNTIVGGTNNLTKINLQFQGLNLNNVQRGPLSYEQMPVTDYMQACVRSGATSTTLRVDEVDTGGSGSSAGSSLGVSHLGTWLTSGTPTNNLGGLIAEVILYNVELSDSDRNTVETYLRTKYGLPNPAATLADPTTITGCKLWLKADAGAYNDAGTTLATDGQTVQQWNDQSGQGNNATQSTSGNRPTFQTNEINTTLPVIRFDGSDDWMQVPSFTIGTLAVVHKFGSSGNYTDYKTPFNDRTASEGRVFLLNSGTTSIYPTNVLMLNRHFRNGTKTNSLAPIDSYQISFGSWPGNTLTDAYDVGRDDQNNSRAWSGDIVEIVAFDRGLSPANRKRIEAYLGNKYGISV